MNKHVGADPAFVASRFSLKVKRGAPTECWPWIGSLNPEGYGVYYVGRKQYRAHRAAVVLDGRHLPENMVVDHGCRNRACVNPAHLRIVDRFTNVHENSEALAHLNALKTHCLRGHPLSGGNLHQRKNGKRECLKCCAARAKEAYHAAKS